jgi:hypothetical protein
MLELRHSRQARSALTMSNDAERLRRELEPAVSEAHALKRELERVRAQNEDLRESAQIWIRMYERQLERANAAESGLPVSRRRSE